MKCARTVFLTGMAAMALFALAPYVRSQDPATAKPATLKILVPAGTTLEIDGVKTKQTGETRRFESPPLDAAKSYYYTVKATFKGKEETAKVSVQAGKEVELDLREKLAVKADTGTPKPDTGTTKTDTGTATKEKPKLTVPFVPTPQEVVDKMLEMAKVTKDDVVYDLGCGDGRIVVTAAKKHGAKGVGVDLDPERIKDSKENAKKANVEDKVQFREGDVLKTDVSSATVVTLYLLPRVNLDLRPILQKTLKPGSRIVSHDFDMGDWKPKATHKMNDSEGIEHEIFLWEITGEEKKNEGNNGQASAADANRFLVLDKEEKKEEKKDREPDVIYVPTPQEVVDKMLETAGVKKGDVVYDLGCGDGRIPVTAAKKFGVKAMGFDIDPERIKESTENVKKNKVEELVTIKKQDIFTLDLSPASVVTLYLLPELNVKLIPQLEKLKAGSRIVSHDFDMRGVKPDKVIKYKPTGENSREHTIYLWTIPLKKEKE